MAARKQKMSNRQPKRLIRIHPVVFMVLIAGGLLGLVFKLNLFQTGQASSSPVSLSIEDRWAAVMKELIGKTRHFRGSPNAPVTILEFSDFQ